MKRREYTKEFKQEAVALSNEQGVNAAQIARELGIEPALLYRWRAEMRLDGKEAFPGKGKLKTSDEEVRNLQRELDRVRMERDILKKALRVFARPRKLKYEFIEAHRGRYPVTIMCQCLGLTTSSYYNWRRHPLSRRAQVNHALLKEIHAIYQSSRGIYGSPKIHRTLKKQGWPCSRKRVARLMRLDGLAAKRQRSFKRTTRQHEGRLAAPNHLAQQFVVSQPNRVWLADITYIRTLEGWLYLAAVMDLFSRQIIGWSMAKRMTDGLSRTALQMAVRKRLPAVSKLMHHSDRGSQYTSEN